MQLWIESGGHFTTDFTPRGFSSCSSWTRTGERWGAAMNDAMVDGFQRKPQSMSTRGGAAATYLPDDDDDDEHWIVFNANESQQWS